ncbi:MAG: hypothetical protein IJY13_02885 [Clostridia bacterium]|nr:hypothetical protein [Clostridia bacterium]
MATAPLPIEKYFHQRPIHANTKWDYLPQTFENTLPFPCKLVYEVAFRFVTKWQKLQKNTAKDFGGFLLVENLGKIYAKRSSLLTAP